MKQIALVLLQQHKGVPLDRPYKSQHLAEIFSYKCVNAPYHSVNDFPLDLFKVKHLELLSSA